MANSQNGWPVVGQSAVTDRAVHGVEFPNGWLKGDVDVVFTYLIDRLHREVEAIDKGGCWGWFVKPIEGSTSISNHASGTAIDYNAPAHPMGVRNTYSAGDRTKIRKILADLSGVVRWGGDYTGRPDDMHFEIHSTRSAVGRVADWIRKQQEDDMPLSTDDKDWIAKTVEAGSRAAVVDVLADGYTAAMGKATGSTDADRGKRNIRDYLRGIVGGPTGDQVDEAEIVSGVLAGLDPAAIAAAIPQNIAAQVADELRARLQA